MAIKFILVSIVASFIVVMSSTVFADGPPIIEIVIEEKITVGDGSKPATRSGTRVPNCGAADGWR